MEIDWDTRTEMIEELSLLRDQLRKMPHTMNPFEVFIRDYGDIIFANMATVAAFHHFFPGDSLVTLRDKHKTWKKRDDSKNLPNK